MASGWSADGTRRLRQAILASTASETESNVLLDAVRSRIGEVCARTMYRQIDWLIGRGMLVRIGVLHASRYIRTAGLHGPHRLALTFAWAEGERCVGTVRAAPLVGEEVCLRFGSPGRPSLYRVVEIDWHCDRTTLVTSAVAYVVRARGGDLPARPVIWSDRGSAPARPQTGR
jgi:hypothetical protein